METIKITKKHHKHLNNPFPSTPKSLPLIQGSLAFNCEKLSSHQIFTIGNDFEILWSSNNGGYLSISHQSKPARPLWSSIPGKAFVSAALAETLVEESRGSFVIKDRHIHLLCQDQTIDDIRVINDQFHFDGPFTLHQNVQFPLVLITGWIFSKKIKKTNQSYVIYNKKDIQFETKAGYWLLFDQKTSHQIGFELKLGQPNFAIRQRRMGRIRIRKRKLGWCWSLTRPKGFVRISSTETENQPAAELKIPIPQHREFNRVFLTYSSEGNERFYGFGEQFSHMDFKGKRVPIFVQEQGIGRGDQPITFAANLVSYRAGGDWSTTYAPSPFYMTSKMRSVYLQGYDYSVFDLTRVDRVQIQIHGNSVQGRILHGNSPCELIEHFTETIGRPPELPDWIVSGAVAGMQGGTDAVRRVWDALRSYQVPVSAFWLQSHEKPNRRRNLFEEAKKLDILVKDKNGEQYLVPNTAFDVGMLDLTHPDTASWFKQVLQEMVEDGVRGWMADFGEGLPVDAILYSGEDPISAHNRYPELWAQINREFVEEWKDKCTGTKREDTEEDLVFFMRAGFRDSPKWGMLFWEGDQMVSWQANDGIKSAVVGLLSSGLSGYAFNHSDIGGYCAVNLPLIKYRRSEELLLRWMELNAFTTVFRTHEEASQKGLPVCRHLFLHYPDDDKVQRLSYQQFLVGTEILVVPILDKGKKKVRVYFPVGETSTWQHIWTEKIFTGQGSEAWVEAPIGYPAVFVKADSIVGETFRKNLRNSDIL
ncbi:sulfoquinovosidase [Citrus sinensis]|uniref:Sulfoquinovosidase n=1 Tax=Citrus sinensis TaxID=2711 RepID=A0ACB8HZI4_CITSI|nr:sulfoquinovosidase [Citrus sinensis]